MTRTYRIAFAHGGAFEFEASRLDDDGNKLRLLDQDGGLVIAYQDSDIVFCAEVPAPGGAHEFTIEKANGTSAAVRADSMELDGPVIRLVTAGRVVTIYRAAHVASAKEQQDG